MFTGDILFIGGTPIVWAGPLANWVAACDLMLGMDLDVIVPGHGPLTDKAGVAAVRDYLSFVDAEATARQAAGLDAFEAAKEISSLLGAGHDFDTWGEAGRIAVNVETVYRTLDPSHHSPDVVEQFRRMAALDHPCEPRVPSERTISSSPRHDVAIVGDGPAGLALAAAARGVGLDVVVVGGGAPWTPTYGTWRDDVAMIPSSCFEHVLPGIAVHGHRRHHIDRAYGILANDALRRHLAAGVEVVHARAIGIRHLAWGSRVRLAEGEVDARIVVDARGRADGGTAAQTAYGVVVDAPPAGGPMLMDLRRSGSGRTNRSLARRLPRLTRPRSATRCPSPMAGSSRRPCSPPARRSLRSRSPPGSAPAWAQRRPAASSS